MSATPSRSLRLVAVAAVVAAVIITATLFVALGTQGTATRTSTLVVASVSTYTYTVTETTTITPSTTVPTCIQLESAPLFLIIKNSSTGAPIGGLRVQVQESPFSAASCSQAASTLDLGTRVTNANGSISVCCTGSTFFFRFVYLGSTYHVSELANGAQSAECVTLDVPSNATVITYSPNFVFQC